MYPNWSNVAEQMSETLKSIESREIEWDSIERRTIDGRSTKFTASGTNFPRMENFKTHSFCLSD